MKKFTLLLGTFLFLGLTSCNKKDTIPQKSAESFIKELEAEYPKAKYISQSENDSRSFIVVEPTTILVITYMDMGEPKILESELRFPVEVNFTD